MSATCPSTCPCIRHGTVDSKLELIGLDKAGLSVIERLLIAALIPTNDVHAYRDVLTAVWPERVERLPDPKERYRLMQALHTHLYLLRLRITHLGWTVQTTAEIGLRLVPCERTPGSVPAWHVPGVIERFLADPDRRAVLMVALAAGKNVTVACRDAGITNRNLRAARRHDTALDQAVTEALHAVGGARARNHRDARTTPGIVPSAPYPRTLHGEGRAKMCAVAGCGLRLASHPRCDACGFIVGAGHVLQLVAGSDTCGACTADKGRSSALAPRFPVAERAYA